MEPVPVGTVPPKGWNEVVYAKDQPQYLPLPALLSMMSDGQMVTRWTLSPEERAAIAGGADVFLTVLTFGRPLQPVLLEVGGSFALNHLRT